MKNLLTCLVIANCGGNTTYIEQHCETSSMCPPGVECIQGWCVFSPAEGESESEAESEAESESEREGESESEAEAESESEGETCVPTGEEICGDDLDNDCDGFIDEAKWIICHVDRDGDGHTSLSEPYTFFIACVCPDGFVPETDEPDDCDPDDPTIYPGAPENCTDGVDGDCDALTDSFDPDCADGAEGESESESEAEAESESEAGCFTITDTSSGTELVAPNAPWVTIWALTPTGLATPGMSTDVLDFIVSNPPPAKELVGICEVVNLELWVVWLRVFWTYTGEPGWAPENLRIGGNGGVLMSERRDIGPGRASRTFAVPYAGLPLEYGTTWRFHVWVDTMGALPGDTIQVAVTRPMQWCVTDDLPVTCYNTLLPAETDPLFGPELTF